MQDTLTVGGRDITVRGLTRSELKNLIAAGMNPAALSMPQADGCMDRMFAMILSEEDIRLIDEMCNSEAVRVFRRILDLTYGREDEIKN